MVRTFQTSQASPLRTARAVRLLTGRTGEGSGAPGLGKRGAVTAGEAHMPDDRKQDPRVHHAERPILTAEDVGDSPAARTWRPLVQPGMYVRGMAGDEPGRVDQLGQVKEVRAGDFLVDRSGAPGLTSDTPIYLPFERIHAIMGDQITLDLTISQVDEQGSVPSPLNL